MKPVTLHTLGCLLDGSSFVYNTFFPPLQITTTLMQMAMTVTRATTTVTTSSLFQFQTASTQIYRQEKKHQQQSSLRSQVMLT